MINLNLGIRLLPGATDGQTDPIVRLMEWDTDVSRQYINQ